MTAPTPPPEMPPLFSSPPTMSWRISDKLLLAQAVHHLGDSPPNWVNVSNLMLTHPLVKTPARVKAAQDAGTTLVRVFGSRECERAWTALMRSNNLVIGEEEEVESSAMILKQRPKEARGLPPKTDRKSQLVLAQILYAERMEELRDNIKRKEEEFKALIAKIDHLKSAAADEQLREELAKQPSPGASEGNQASSKGDQVSQATPPSSYHDSLSASQPHSSPTVLRARNRPNRGRPAATPSEASTFSNIKASDERQSSAVASDDGNERTAIEQTESDGVEAALGGSTPQAGSAAGDSKSVAGSHKFDHAEEDSGEEIADGAEAVAKSHTLEGKRTRSSTNSTVTNNEEVEGVGASTKKRRPAPLQRRSRRGDNPVEQETGDDGSEGAVTPTRPRHSTRRNTRHSREASAIEDTAMDEDEAKAETKDDASQPVEAPPVSAHSTRRDRPRVASSSARHSVDSGWEKEKDNVKDKNKERERRRKANEKLLLQIWTEVSAHTHGNLFQNEVKESDAPDYHGLIRRPTSLKTIKSQIKEGEISTATQLRRSFNHLFANAMMYNRPGSEVNRMAQEMRQAMENVIDRFEESRGFSGRR